LKDSFSKKENEKMKKNWNNVLPINCQSLMKNKERLLRHMNCYQPHAPKVTEGGHSGKKHGSDNENPNTSDDTQWDQPSDCLKSQKLSH
jgi:hypothetical protein